MSRRRRMLPVVGTLLLLVAGSVVATGGVAEAANPIIVDRFVADPSAHVFNNRMYIYVTDDETNSGTYWDSKDWRGYSSSDLVNWTDHGQVLDVTTFSWAGGLAWAPEATSRNGYYYLYLPMDRTKIGVARSTSPMSGFTDVRGTPLIDKARDVNTGEEPIDPAVFTDDDGQAYLYFGTRTPKVVKLGADMMSTSGAIQSLSVSGNNYGEAPWLFKRNGVYYFSYSTGWPGQIAYATGTSPLGPFTYRGVVLDYVNINTNHQSILQYRGEWYVVYHKNGRPGGGRFKRSLAMDHLYFNTDGTIRQVVQTTTGVGPVRPPASGEAVSTFTALSSGKRAAVAGGSTANAAAAVQTTASTAASQRWQVTDASGGYHTLVNLASGKCLDVSGGSTANGAQLIQYTCSGATNQQWQLKAAGGGLVQLVARHSGQCADVSGFGTADGVALIQWPCGTGTNQQWSRADG